MWGAFKAKRGEKLQPDGSKRGEKLQPEPDGCNPVNSATVRPQGEF
ncbi:hypothetical protein LTSEMIS_2843 [Salmonella enterica subsp. enterica serovar Mississippi str. A4-633]|nr:hypothetical protein LTSEMIS_2843 [Salmonella enterica subsp. enterica serovar Mississippi str. A4-633]